MGISILFTMDPPLSETEVIRDKLTFPLLGAIFEQTGQVFFGRRTHPVRLDHLIKTTKYAFKNQPIFGRPGMGGIVKKDLLW
jgi:hypothetical protein